MVEAVPAMVIRRVEIEVAAVLVRRAGEPAQERQKEIELLLKWPVASRPADMEGALKDRLQERAARAQQKKLGGKAATFERSERGQQIADGPVENGIQHLAREASGRARGEDRH